MRGESVGVVLPAYNEAEYLDATVADLLEGLRKRRDAGAVAAFEIVVVENGSTDATRDRAAALADTEPEVRVVELDRADYGAALRAGVLTVDGDHVVCFDVDYYDLEFLDAALEALVDADVVVGSKRAEGSIDARPWQRRLVTAGFATTLHLGFGLDVSDTHGMKLMRRDVVLPLVQRCRFDADLFDTELVVRTVRAGGRVAELPVAVAERRPPRTSIWTRVPRTLLGLARLRLALVGDRT